MVRMTLCVLAVHTLCATTMASAKKQTTGLTCAVALDKSMNFSRSLANKLQLNFEEEIEPFLCLHPDRPLPADKIGRSPFHSYNVENTTLLAAGALVNPDCMFGSSGFSCMSGIYRNSRQNNASLGACIPGFYCPLNQVCLLACDFAGAYCPSYSEHTVPAQNCPTGASNDPKSYCCDMYDGLPVYVPIANSTVKKLVCGGAHNQTYCPAGYYCPDPLTRKICPVGSFCASGFQSPSKCAALTYCGQGSVAAQANFGGFLLILFLVALFGGVRKVVGSIRQAARDQRQILRESGASQSTFGSDEAKKQTLAAIDEEEEDEEVSSSLSGATKQFNTAALAFLRSQCLPTLMTVSVGLLLQASQNCIDSHKPPPSGVGESCLSAYSGKFAYAIAVGAVSTCLCVIWSSKTPLLNFPVASFLCLWWLIAAGLLTFDEPYTQTGNAFFTLWVGAITSTVLAIQYIPVTGALPNLLGILSTPEKDGDTEHLGTAFFDAHQQNSPQHAWLPQQPCALLLLASLVEFFAAIKRCHKDNCDTTNGIAVGIGCFSMTCCIGLLFFTKGLTSDTEQLLRKVPFLLLLMWTAAVYLLTFRGPFEVREFRRNFLNLLL